MNLKQVVDQLRLLPPVTQVALIGFALAVIVLLVVFPGAGTSIITFMVTLKMFATER